MPFDSGDYEANKEKERAQQKAYREANKEKIAAQHKAYREANKEKIAARNRAYREANKEKVAGLNKAYREANKEKVAARQKAYREANKEKIAARQKAYNEANKEKIKAYKEANLPKYMFSNAYSRAKKNNIPFNLTEDYLKSIYPSDMICPVLGFEMSVGLDENGSSETSPSLDRIIPEKGYVQGNVVVVSMRANTIKRDATPEELRKVTDFYEKVFEQLDDSQLELDFMNES
jgi:DNA repair exonuclease SbcCD ATPase subunit